MAGSPAMGCHPAQAQVVLRLADGEFEAAGVVGVARVAPWGKEFIERDGGIVKVVALKTAQRS